jgi:hypothetical protein
MRSILLSLCLIFAFANIAQAAGLQSRILDPQVGAQTTYEHIPAYSQALACSDPPQQADCKMYFAGFAHAIDLLLSTDPSTKGNEDGLCGDITDLIYEFVHEVQVNPKAHDSEMHIVLFALLVKDHSCTKIKGRIQNTMSAGDLIDMCHAGDIGFGLCSEYQAGFISALLFVSEQTREPILCGDQRLVNPVSVSRMLNDGLQADFRLRRDSAVVVMLNELKAKMPCSNK